MFTYIMMNKPQRYICAKTDASRKTVMELLEEELRAKLHPVGRLDRDTEGLLLFTDDGRVDYSFLNPQHHVSKQYYFKAFGAITDENKRAIEQGITLYESGEHACPCRLEIIEVSTVLQCSDQLPEFRKKRYLANPNGMVTTGKITLTEGKKHEVKLILKSVGCKIFYLRRDTFGSLTLDENLKAGEYRELNPEEMEGVYLTVAKTYTNLTHKDFLIG